MSGRSAGSGPFHSSHASEKCTSKKRENIWKEEKKCLHLQNIINSTHKKTMKRKTVILFFTLFISLTMASAQTTEKSNLQQRAETEIEKGKTANARSLYILAYEDYARKGQMKQAVECGTKAAPLYVKDNLWKEAFELLRNIDQAINADKNAGAASRAALHYRTTKERLAMYIKLRKSPSALEQLKYMETHAANSGDESLADDLLYQKAIYYYTFGQNAQGNAVFKEMASKLTAQKEYDKVDEVYRTLIANGRKSGSANLVAQSYNSYMLWKDSVSALKSADEIGALKKQIADNEAEIADKDGSLSSRKLIIIGLCVLAAALAVALVLGALVLMRFILLTRKQKKTIKTANENNALKAKFINNISAQLEPTLKKLDGSKPEVKALQDFSTHIQTLASLESTADEAVELEETQVPQFCEALAESARKKVRSGVTLKVEAPKMGARINREYVSYILTHLLNNAAEFTPADGTIALEFKKRGAHSYQFLVSDTGQGIAEEQREDVFKPFLQVRDLTQGDGLGLPICKQMAMKMNGDLEIDPKYTRGTRFVLSLHA